MILSGFGRFPQSYTKLHGQIYLGDKAVVACMQSLLAKDEAIQEIPHVQRWPVAKPLVEYRSEYAHAPHSGMALAYLSGDHSMKAIAEIFGVHYATVSRAGFPLHKSLEEFDYRFQTTISKREVSNLLDSALSTTATTWSSLVRPVSARPI